MRTHRRVPWIDLLAGLLFATGSLAIYVVIFPRPDVVDGPNPIVLGYASFALAALGGVRLGTALHRWLGNDGRLPLIVTEIACVVLVAGVTQGVGWVLDPGFFEWGVLRTFVWLVVVFGVTIVVLREVVRLLVRALRRGWGRWTDGAPPSHD